MTTNERFHAIMQFKPFDRLPILEWAGWWDKTIARWHGEGLPEQITDRYEIFDYFGLDVYKQDWLRPWSAETPKAPHHGAGIMRDEKGYEGLLPTLYQKNCINTSMWERWAVEQERGDVVLWFSLDGFFWYPRHLFGIEGHLYSFYDYPKLMHIINEDLVDWMIYTIDALCQICVPDFMTFAEDMSYNHGPMLSEDLFNEFMLPYYNRVIPELTKRGIVPIIDSDGDITEAAPWFERAGIEGILPLERQAGVELQVLRDRHPSMKFIGHFDKMTMNKGRDAMEREFERLFPVAVQGGFLPSCDHQTPPGVSLADYRIYLQLFNEFAERVGAQSRDSG